MLCGIGAVYFCQNMKRRDVLYAIKHPKSTEELEHERYLNNIHQLIYPQVKNRTLVVYTSLARFYRKRSPQTTTENNNNCWFCEKEDLLAGLHEFKIHLNAGECLFSKKTIKEYFAYLRLDPIKTGETSLDKMKKFLNLFGHPYAVRALSVTINSDDDFIHLICNT
ncbi:unnamed protein product [Didymodactylos carnosus]|uniref:Uncharacterized protein n=1 Tax=Didymodactylos carnosus TaxID=1234261 RepID=A0A813SBN7_9BILA|nr:unnamed protein product [Didymodactylos carnosus]CAF3578455.1 unnamed protein product [Didymodactylos carnosus]